ncbi:MAG TPA: NAD(P)/FAD-dependent oxidoreductase [Pseudonocardiaceae bacterium]
MFDAIIVGARCGGAATALLLGIGGYRVLLVDRATFPADTMSTLYIHQTGVALLARWGVLDRVVASGCPRLDRVTYGVDDVRLHGRAATVDGIDCGFAPRRTALDQALVDAAVRAGAEFVDSRAVVGLLSDGDRVTGVRLAAGPNGATQVPAALVVGADGMRSTIARLVDAPYEVSAPRATCVYYSMWEGMRREFSFYERTGRWVAVIPSSDDVTFVATYQPQDRFAAIRTSALEAHQEAVRTTAPEVAEHMSTCGRTDRLHGSGDQQNFFRTAAGPGWALVGDAGHHKDSITARGITDAFRQAELLADSIGDRLRDQHHLDSALARFTAGRTAAMSDGYRSTMSVARLQVNPAKLAMLRAIGASPELTDRYFEVFAGVRALDDLLTPQLMAGL